MYLPPYTVALACFTQLLVEFVQPADVHTLSLECAEGGHDIAPQKITVVVYGAPRYAGAL